MIITEFICDRCGIKTKYARRLTIQFGANDNTDWPLPDLCTGDLCTLCQIQFAEKYYNSILDFIKGA